MMSKNIEITPEIQENWDARVCIASDILNESDDVLTGKLQEYYIFSDPENDILIDYQSNVTGKPKELPIEYADCDTLPIEFGSDSLYASTKLSPLFGNTDSDIIYSVSNDIILLSGKESDRFFDIFVNDSYEGNTAIDILYGNSKDEIVISGKESDRLFDLSVNDSCEGNIGDGFFYDRGNNKNILNTSDRNDYLWVREADNSLLVQADSENLFGESGNDILLGEAGSSIIYGNGGNDIIHSTIDPISRDKPTNYQSDIDTEYCGNEAEIVKKVLLDADIILDVLLERKCTTLEDSVAAFDLVSSKLVKGYIASSDFDQIVSLAQRLLNPENASRIEQKLLNFLEVCEVDGQLLRETSQMSLPKFKNTIQLACALKYNLDAIVTVNSQDFWGDENLYPEIDVFTPSEFLNNYYGLDTCEWVNDEYEELREKLEKDLEADCMVNEEILDKKISLGTGWVVDSWIVRSDQNNFTEASVILRNPETSDRHPAFVRAQAPIEASCNALDKLVKQLFDEAPEYSFKDFVTRNVSDEGAASTVEATVIVQCGDLIYTSNYTHKSIIQAVFYAYVKSVDKILRSETPENADKSVRNFVNKSKWAQGLP
jgi:RTX calcium-binding nonapeptide repeat (4 copies)